MSGVSTTSGSGGVVLRNLQLLTQGDWVLDTGGRQLLVSNLTALAVNSHLAGPKCEFVRQC